jgi:head-tail adaptor
MTSGELRERVSFQTRGGPTDDGYGNQVDGTWIEQFNCAAGFTYLQGSETVISQRLQGVQPIIIKVRSALNTRQVDAAWRAVDARTQTVYNIRSSKTDPKRRYIEFMVDAGAAV